MRGRALAAIAAIAVLALVAGCGSSSASSTSASNSSASSTGAASSTASAQASNASGSSSTSSCGSKPGVKASGTPINLGAIATKEPGSDFSDVPNMVAAYFDCVNDNGGITGHPVKMFIEFNQGQPAQVAAAAAQLIQTDHVVGIVGAFDLLECTINANYWQKLGVYELDAGIAPGCWSTPNSASVNMGPRFTSDGAVQYALTKHPSKIVFVEANIPVAGYMAAGPAALAKAAGVPMTTQIVRSPVQDPNSVALNAVNAAGPNGWVDLAFTPPDALPVLQAAQKLGLEDRVKGWGCSSTCNTDFLAKALGPKWNHKLFVNAELADPDDHNGTDMQLYKAIFNKYGHNVSGGIGSFSEFGFLDAKIAAYRKVAGTGPMTNPSGS